MDINFILEKALGLYSDKEAVVCGRRRFTYSEFADRVYRLSNFLAGQGIGRGDCVAVLHQNSHEFLEAYFAAARLGAILNPLNFRLTAREIAFIIDDSGASVLIAAGRYGDSVDSLAEIYGKLRCILWTGDVSDREPLSRGEMNYEKVLVGEGALPPPLPDIGGDDPAHLYYTSGTTGRPKGVILTHGNVCTHALAAVAELGLRDRDRWIHAAPLFHLADAWAAFSITWVGGKHIITEDFEPREVALTMDKEGVTATNLVPTMLNMLVNTPEVMGCDFSSLRLILSGGSPIAPEVVRKVMDTFRCEYVQTYGMTETSPFLTLSLLKEGLEEGSEAVRFAYKTKTGRSFLGVLLRVVREDGRDVEPDGREVGEIIVKGDIVTPGYWNLPEETEKAIKDGWFYTGDLAVMDKEGYVDIVDRKKDMIITGGENVYSTEVENILYGHEAVLEAAVVGVPDQKWGEAVKAFVVLKEEGLCTEEEVIAFCKGNLAKYKVPKKVEILKELPKTGSGKIYKKALKEREEEAAGEERGKEGMFPDCSVDCFRGRGRDS